MANAAKLSNLAVLHMQKEYQPLVKRDEEFTTPGLTFIDRMLLLNRFTPDTIKTEVEGTLRSPIFEADQLHGEQGTLSSHSASNSASPLERQDQLNDLRVYMSSIVNHLISRRKELDEENTEKVVTLMLELLVHSSDGTQLTHENKIFQFNVPPKLNQIWRESISAFSRLCGKSDSVCSILNANENRSLFIKCLIGVATICHRDPERMQLLLDSLIVLGDLTAS